MELTTGSRGPCIITTDGREFDSVSKAVAHERRLARPTVAPQGDYAIGDEVQVYDGKRQRWLPGVITRVARNGQYQVDATATYHGGDGISRSRVTLYADPDQLAKVR